MQLRTQSESGKTENKLETELNKSVCDHTSIESSIASEREKKKMRNEIMALILGIWIIEIALERWLPIADKATNLTWTKLVWASCLGH